MPISLMAHARIFEDRRDLFVLTMLNQQPDIKQILSTTVSPLQWVLLGGSNLELRRFGDLVPHQAC